MAQDTAVKDAPVMATLPSAPVAAGTADFTGVLDYIKAVSRDHAQTARLEAARLAPYLTALSRQLFTDLLEKEATKTANDGVRVFGPPTMPEIMKPRKLSRLFTAVAKDSQNVILSEMIVASEGLLNNPVLAAIPHKKFFSADTYQYRQYGLGFIQVPAQEGRDSVSVSVLTLSSGVMLRTPAAAATPLLTALQKIVTAGNHDMQHHYTNKLLNANISTTTKNEMLNPADGLTAWHKRYFTKAYGDKSADSYESWLMLNHSRTFMQMDPDHHTDVQAAVAEYFDMLDGLSKTMSPHDIDYLAMMACFALQRYVTLDHPLMLYAVARTEKMDSQPHKVKMARDAFKDKMQQDEKLAEIAASYPDLLDDTSYLSDYQRGRLLQIALLESWSVKLLAPVNSKSSEERRLVHQRTGKANLEMVKAAAHDSSFDLPDGTHRFTRDDGDKVTYRALDGVLHSDKQPALVIKDTEGRQFLSWYTQGQLQRKIRKSRFREIEEHYDNGVLHRDDGPALISTYPDGTREETWYRNGERHRDDDPALILASADGSREEIWYRHGKPHREDGPAVVTIEAEGTGDEKWYLNDQLHREDGPAQIWTNTAGTVNEIWYRHGEIFTPSAEQQASWQARAGAVTQPRTKPLPTPSR